MRRQGKLDSSGIIILLLMGCVIYYFWSHGGGNEPHRPADMEQREALAGHWRFQSDPVTLTFNLKDGGMLESAYEIKGGMGLGFAVTEFNHIAGTDELDGTWYVSNGALTMRLDHCPNVLGDAFQKLIVTLSNATSSAKDSPYTPIGPLQIDSITADTVAFSNGRTMHR